MRESSRRTRWWLRTGGYRGAVLGAGVFPVLVGSAVAVWGLVRGERPLAGFGVWPIMSVIGVIVGPAWGLIVGLLAAVIDGLSARRWSRRSVAIAAILIAGLPVMVWAVITDLGGGLAFGFDTTKVAALFVGAPGLVGIVSLWVTPLEQVERRDTPTNSGGDRAPGVEIPPKFGCG